MEGRSLQVEGVQWALELVVSHVAKKEEKKKNKVIRWSTEKMEEK